MQTDFTRNTEQIKSAANSPPNALRRPGLLPAWSFLRRGITKRREVKRMLQVKDIEKKILVTAVDEAPTTYVVPT